MSERERGRKRAKRISKLLTLRYEKYRGQANNHKLTHDIARLHKINKPDIGIKLIPTLISYVQHNYYTSLHLLDAAVDDELHEGLDLVEAGRNAAANLRPLSSSSPQ